MEKKKFEYNITGLPYSENETTFLNRMGGYGWELTSIVFIALTNDKSYYFKREKS